jgi:hypothetical protein
MRHWRNKRDVARARRFSTGAGHPRAGGDLALLGEQEIPAGAGMTTIR